MNLTIIFLVLCFIALWLLFKAAPSKGEAGEWQVSNWLSSLPSKSYRLLNNVTLPTADGTTQIDHIVVSHYGIFVIETKNMQGWLFADKQQKIWTQKLGKQNYSFQNPLHQNYKHVQTLQTLLGIDTNYLFSLVVFVGKAEFKTPVPEGVVLGKAIIITIKAKQQPLLSDEQVQTYCQKIETTRLKPSKKTERQHRQHVQQIVQAKETASKPQQHEKPCPKCGKPLVLRTAQRGQNKGKNFVACSGFPDCRFIE